MKAALTISILFISFLSEAQWLSWRLHRIGWQDWNTDTKYYDSTTVIKSVHMYKMKRKSIGCTTKITMHKLILFDTNGNWYLKTKYKVNAGCFHFERSTRYTRERKEYKPADETSVEIGFMR